MLPLRLGHSSLKVSVLCKQFRQQTGDSVVALGKHILSGTSMRDVRRFVYKLGLTQIERNVKRGNKQSVEKDRAVQRVYDLASEKDSSIIPFRGKARGDGHGYSAHRRDVHLTAVFSFKVKQSTFVYTIPDANGNHEALQMRANNRTGSAFSCHIACFSFGMAHNSCLQASS